MDERRDDWHRGVDENLASLNTGQRVNDRLIEDLDLQVNRLESILHGTDTAGLIGRLEVAEHTVAELRAIVIMDASGQRGLQHDIQELKGGREDRRLTFGNLTKIVVAAIMSGLITHFWQDIRSFMNPKSIDPVEQMIENTKHPKNHYHHYTIHVKPEEPTE